MKKKRLDATAIAKGLGAKQRGTVCAKAGYHGALGLLTDVEARFRVPDADVELAPAELAEIDEAIAEADRSTSVSSVVVLAELDRIVCITRR